MDDLSKLAVNAALTRDWKEAIRLNLKILKGNSRDIEALNRLGRAYFETGLKTKAEAVYKKVLRLDKFNSIATKNLELLKTSRLVRRAGEKIDLAVSSPIPVFLEEPGVTKTVSLTRPGDPKVTSRLHPGDPVSIVPRDHCVTVVSNSNQYLGRLPDDLASRLLTLLKSGNRYHAWIRSLDGNIKVFIKEEIRSSKFKNVPSFPITEKLTYAAFTPPELVHTEKPDVTGTEEQEDVTSYRTDDSDAPETPESPSSDF